MQLGDAELRAEDIIEATDYVCPSLEILDTSIFRQNPQSSTAPSTLDNISNNAASAGVALGSEKHKVTSHHLRWNSAIVSRNEEVEETDLSAGVLNDPMISVFWLARRMARYGQKIKLGQIVPSKSFIHCIQCPTGSHIRANFGSFSQVAI